MKVKDAKIKVTESEMEADYRELTDSRDQDTEQKLFKGKLEACLQELKAKYMLKLQENNVNRTQSELDEAHNKFLSSMQEHTRGKLYKDWIA